MAIDRKKLTIGGAAALTAALIVAVVSRGEDAPPPPPPPVPVDAAMTLGLTKSTDLATRAVKPGEIVTTGVNLPAGWRVGIITYTSQAAGKFETVGVKFVDNVDATWFELQAKNVSEDTVRLLAVFDYGPPETDVTAPDAGVTDAATD